MRGPADPDRKRAQRRDRQRRWRQRQAAGSLSVSVTLSPSETAKLARLEYLGLDELENRKRVAEAIRLLLVAIVLDP